jgi:C4-type Zn-finger protein
MDHVHNVVLACHTCHGEHLHEVTYAGRLLASTVCSNCGHRIAKDLPGLRRAYLADVEHRVRTKPRRMLRRVIRHPVSFALDLPGALLVKPAKMEAELRVLYGRR